MIRLKNIKVIFDPGTNLEKQALQGINMIINEGEFLTVIGSNGAGKTTLLNTLAGDTIASSGTLMIDNLDVTSLPSYKRAHLVARVFQDPLSGTCANLTMVENLALSYQRGRKRFLSPAISKARHEEFKDRIAHLGLGLETRLDLPISLLSGGQRQIISLVMATLSPSKILLLDEHLSALDPKTAEFVLDLTNQLVKENHLTALMVTHSLHQALKVGNRMLMMHKGRILSDICEEKRKDLTTQDLMHQFKEIIDDDRAIFEESF